MASNLFEKILKIIQIVVSLLQIAVKSFTGIDDSEDEDKETV